MLFRYHWLRLSRRIMKYSNSSLAGGFDIFSQYIIQASE